METNFKLESTNQERNRMEANETRLEIGENAQIDETNVQADDPLRQALSNVFGFRSFRPYQEEIIRAILSGRDVLAVMPTGGGKSLCYQLPALLMDGLCVVVSPLLSLMKDQVDAALENGVNAATLNSTTTSSEWRDIMDLIERGFLDLLYVSPERVNTEHFQDLLGSCKVSFFAIDEAHCISQWGHNFRADYLELGLLVDKHPDCPIAAFTATATSQVSDDIVNSLRLRDPFCVRASFDRPNLFYQIMYKDSVNEQILQFLQEVPNESGIIYRSTRKKVEETTDFLVKAGFKAAAYHAGMSDRDRARVQEEFAKDETPVIVATVAFGMGIDKSNVRFVVHGDMPKDVESYYQETGRAGRDGAPARCLLLFGYQDKAIHESFLKDYQDPTAREAASQRLNEMVRFAETDGCRRVNLLKYFGETYVPKLLGEEDGASGVGAKSRSCGACDYCVGVAPRVDVTIDAQKALSAMQRTGNRFGVTHLIDILRGETTQKVRDYGHDRLPTFGVGSDHTKVYWRYLIQALITQEIATLDPTFEFPIPQVSALGWEVMRGKRKVEMLERPDRTRKRERSAIVRRSGDPYDKNNLNSYERRLFEFLRMKRMEIANLENVKPYMIFSDKTLVDIATLKPTTDGDFLLVNGVGQRKLENYGYEFMEFIKEFLDNNPR